MTTKKRYQTSKFYGPKWSVIDVLTNSTVAVHPTRQAAKEDAAFRNETWRVARKAA